MELRSIRHLWGIEEAWEDAIPKIKRKGYYAVETPLQILSNEDQERLKTLLQENCLKLVNQIHTDSYAPGERSKDVQHHVENFRKGVILAKGFGKLLLFCNSHSGYEGWKMSEKEDFFRQCLQIEKELDIEVLHETHRRRIFYNPWDTRDILLKFPELKVTADLSHWFVVLSNDLDGEMDIITLLAERTQLIHARVGYDNGPQVNDPRTPENQVWLEAHEKCWDMIWKSQQKRGLPYSYMEPEFGPPPYMPTLPSSNEPVANLWDICEWQTERQIKRFHAWKWRYKM